MCVIVDVHMAHMFVREPQKADIAPVHKWLSTPRGMLVYGGRLAKELAANDEVRRWLISLNRAGRAYQEDAAAIQEETRNIRHLCKSDDPHIIGLARVSGARLICTQDRDLHTDIGNPQLLANPRGRIYQNQSHKHLLKRNLCRKQK